MRLSCREETRRSVQVEMFIVGKINIISGVPECRLFLVLYFLSQNMSVEITEITHWLSGLSRTLPRLFTHRSLSVLNQHFADFKVLYFYCKMQTQHWHILLQKDGECVSKHLPFLHCNQVRSKMSIRGGVVFHLANIRSPLRSVFGLHRPLSLSKLALFC